MDDFEKAGIFCFLSGGIEAVATTGSFPSFSMFRAKSCRKRIFGKRGRVVVCL